MFILSLRGRFGAIVAIRLHLLSIALTVIIFSSSMLSIQLAALAAFLTGSYFTLVNMDKNKKSLSFNGESNREYAYPSRRNPALCKAEKLSSYLQGSCVVIFFGGGLLLALKGPEATDPPTGLIAIAYYLGCLTLIDVIHRFNCKRDH